MTACLLPAFAGLHLCASRSSTALAVDRLGSDGHAGATARNPSCPAKSPPWLTPRTGHIRPVGAGHFCPRSAPTLIRESDPPPLDPVFWYRLPAPATATAWTARCQGRQHSHAETMAWVWSRLRKTSSGFFRGCSACSPGQSTSKPGDLGPMTFKVCALQA